MGLSGSRHILLISTRTVVFLVDVGDDLGVRGGRRLERRGATSNEFGVESLTRERCAVQLSYHCRRRCVSEIFLSFARQVSISASLNTLI